MGDKLLKAYERTVLRYPGLTLLLVTALAIAMALGLPNFRIDASADSLTLENDDDLDFFRELNLRYGSSDILVVTYKPRGVDLFSDESLSTLQALTEDLAKVPGVINVQSIINVPLLFSPKVEIADLKEEARTLLTPGTDRAAAKREFTTSPIYRDLILGPDGQTTGIVATLSGDPKYVELVRQRDDLRLKRKSGGLTPEEEAELERVSQEFLDYRTRAAEISYDRVQAIRTLMDGYRDRAELFMGGATMITADMVDYVAGDMKLFGAAVVLFVIVALAVIFRQLRWVVLPLLSTVLAVVIMLGWLAWIDWRLTVISSNFIAILLIIVMAVTIHLVVRYRELHWQNPDWPNVQLVRETVGSMFAPCLYTVLTTMVAFASLVVSNIRPVIDFGWMMTIGLLVAFVLVFLVIPAGILVWGKKPVQHRISDDNPHAALFARFTERRGGLVLGISAVLTLVSAVGLTRLQVDNRFIDYFRDSTEIHQGLAVIDQNLGGTTPLDIIIRRDALPTAPIAQTSTAVASAQADDGGYGDGEDPFASPDAQADPFAEDADPFAAPDPQADPFAENADPFADNAVAAPAAQVPYNYWFTRAGLGELEKLQTFLEEMPEIGKVNSPVTLYQVARELTGSAMNDFELTFIRQTLSPEIHNFLVAPYLDNERQEARFTMRTVETASDLKRADLLANIDRFLQEEMGLSPDEYRFSGLLVLYNNMLQSLYTSQILTIGAVFLGILAMFLVLFRSIKVSLIAIAPNLLAAAVVIGGMGLVGLPLDMMTITIAAIVVGIGVDDTIHYIHRFQHEFQRDRNYLATMHRAHGSIGKAMYYTSVIIIAGFSILTLSNFIPTILFGLLTGVAMLVALLGAMALLPKLILVIKPFGPEAVDRHQP